MAWFAASKCPPSAPTAGPTGWSSRLPILPTNRSTGLLVVPHYRLVGSGLVWPDLGAQRIRAVTRSERLAPERLPSSESDIFRITLDPGAIVTFFVETADQRIPEIHLWQPDAYEDMINSYTLYRGVVLGIAGLLALFLSVLFVVKGTAMFPATAALAWAVLAYISIDFGFWSRVFQSSSGNMAVSRAATEVVLAGALLIFLYTYLHLHRWHVRYSHVAVLWLLGLFVLAGVIAVDPAIASGIARISLGVTAAIGLLRHPLPFDPRLRPRDHADPDVARSSASGSPPPGSP